MTNQRLISVCSFLLFTMATIAVMAVSPDTASALDIKGRVVNGTTGEPAGVVNVTVVDPRHGMATEGEITTDAQGNFIAKNLKEDISVFLFQVNYEGVMYTEVVNPEELSDMIEVKIYESTTSWEGVLVALPHFMARRSHDTLSIDRLYMINNLSDPPRTVMGKGAGFRVMIPDDNIEITQMFVTDLGIPITVEPRPSGEPNISTIDYAFKPGETRVGISYSMNYATERYDYEETLEYGLTQLIVMTEDPSMEVSSKDLEFPEAGETHGFRSFRFGEFAKSSTLPLTFRKGEAHLHGRSPVSQQQSGHQIVNLEAGWEQFTFIIIIGFTLLLVLVAALGTKSSLDPDSQVIVMTTQRNSLVGQIAKLDDLYETGTLTDQLYKSTRLELVEKLARTIYKIDKLQPKQSKSARKRKGSAHV